MRKALSIALQVGSFTATSNEAALTTQSLLSASVQSFSFVGLPAIIENKRVVQVELGSFAFVGNAVGLADTEKLSAALGEFAVTAAASELVLLRRYDVANYALSGKQVVLLKQSALNATRGRFRAKFTGKRQVVFVF